MKMHSSMIPPAVLVAKMVTFLLLTLYITNLSLALPSSSKQLNNKLYNHMIKTRSVGQRYCGNHIVNILSMLCDGNYFSPSKRNNVKQESNQNKLHNGIPSIWDDLTADPEYEKPDESSSEYFLEPKEAFNMFGGSTSGEDSFTRNRRGIVDECCKKACTIKELYSYCE